MDEKVVYDNFEGVWQSSTSPTVMGRWSSPKKNGIWNDTAIMLQFDEIPDKNIKVCPLLIVSTYDWTIFNLVFV